MFPYKKIVIVHGYLSTPRHHWYSWIKKELSTTSDDILIPAMPDPRNPDPRKWNDTLISCIPEPDSNTLFICHSLGCLAVLHFLSGLKSSTKIGGCVFVSGFSERIEGFPNLDCFFYNKIDFPLLSKKIQNRIVVFSEDDKIIPAHHTMKLGALLGGESYRVSKGGHFTQNDGFKSFTLLKNILLNLVPVIEKNDNLSIKQSI